MEKQNLSLVDRFGRTISYMRVSVTDRCNLRCIYCMPETGLKLLPRESILKYEEILRLIGIAAELNIYRFRITGGEPLLREGITDFIGKAVATVDAKGYAARGSCEFTLTTNGLLLENMAEDIFRAGIRRINVSLDTLRPDRFIKITRNSGMETVLRGIKKAKATGFSPVKVNVVVTKGFNEYEIDDFIKFAHETGVIVRFIEQMPFGYFEALRRNDPDKGEVAPGYVSLDSIEAEMVKKYRLKLSETPGAGPGRHYGFVGFIPARSRPFCHECNRIRLTPDGKLRLCLGYPYEIDVRTPLRRGASDDELKEIFLKAVQNKPEKHDFEKKLEKECMAQIGG